MEEFTFEKPELDDYEKVRAVIKGCLADEVKYRKVALACEEIFVNIVSYSGAEHAGVTVREKDGELLVVFSDDGVPFDPTLPRKMKEFEELDTGGMGISMAKDIADEMTYKHEEGKNILALSFRI